MNERSKRHSGDLVGQVLGEFHLLRRLGRGGMADVYLAEQKSLSRYVAIKVLRPEMLSKDDVALKRFEQEARAAGSLSDSAIVQVLTVGEQDEIHYIVQEYVDGVNLSEHVKRHGPVDAATGLRIMRDVTCALKAASDAGIVHRDVKPENIMLARNGAVKVTDFGLAQLSAGSDDLNLTKIGTTMGTPLYMSPEQINGKKLDLRSDLYSLGITCHHMFSGRPPFLGETAMAVAVQHLKEEAPSLSERRSDLPNSICRVIEKMIRKKPEDRFQDADSLLNTLKKIEDAGWDEQDSLALSALEMPVMPARKRNDFAWPSVGTLAAFVATCITVAAISAWIGDRTRPVDPLSVSAKKQPSKPSAKLQFGAALMNRESKSAWGEVIEHYGDTDEGGWARIRLAELYLQEERWDDASALYEQLVLCPVSSPFPVHGHTGRAIVAANRGNYEQSEALFEERVSADRKALSRAMLDLWEKAHELNLENLKKATEGTNEVETSSSRAS